MKNKKRKVFTVFGLIFASIVIFLGIICVQINGDTIVKNTYVNNINIGGLTKEEAIKKLNEDNEVESLKLYYEDKKWNIESHKVDFSYDINETVKKAYQINRRGSFFENLSLTIKSNFNSDNKLKFIVTYSEDKLKSEIEKIAKDIDFGVVNAKINVIGSEIIVEEDMDGLKVNIEKTIDNIKENVENGIFDNEIVVEVVNPDIKKEDLQEINTVLGSYSTTVTGPVTGRHTNIRLATERTSDVLLMPGETFSYNEHTGLRSAENGYKYAPVIVQGVLQEGLGGGVCQVSSTLFNATLYAGLEYVNLRNHSIPSGYVDMGRDAVVSDTGLDFVFKNNLDHPIYIKNYMSGNVITCKIYGSSKDKQNISIATNTDKIEDAPIKKVDDPSLPKGEEKVIEKGRKGYTVSTYRIYKDANGEVLRQEKVLVSIYPKRQETVAVGTLEIQVPEQPEKPQTPEGENPENENVENSENPDGTQVENNNEAKPQE